MRQCYNSRHNKRWNDSYGHPAGDVLLRELAQLLRSAAAAHDLVARNGGDEFCLVFVETEKAAAIERAEVLRRAIAAVDVAALRPPGAAADVHITASIGVAAHPEHGDTIDELLATADRAMYGAKHAGRDRIQLGEQRGTLLALPSGARRARARS